MCFFFREGFHFTIATTFAEFLGWSLLYKIEFLTCVSTTIGIIPMFFSCSPEYFVRLVGKMMTLSLEAYNTRYHYFDCLYLATTRASILIIFLYLALC